MQAPGENVLGHTYSSNECLDLSQALQAMNSPLNPPLRLENRRQGGEPEKNGFADKRADQMNRH